MAGIAGDDGARVPDRVAMPGLAVAITPSPMVMCPATPDLAGEGDAVADLRAARRCRPGRPGRCRAPMVTEWPICTRLSILVPRPMRVSLEGRAVDGGQGADLDVVLDHHDPDLRDLLVAAVRVAARSRSRRRRSPRRSARPRGGRAGSPRAPARRSGGRSRRRPRRPRRGPRAGGPRCARRRARAAPRRREARRGRPSPRRAVGSHAGGGWTPASRAGAGDAGAPRPARRPGRGSG